MTFMKRAGDIALISAFLLILFFPLAAKELSLGVQTQELMARENRTMAERPVLVGERFRYGEVKRFPGRMEKYLADTMPFRLQVISGIARAEREFFRAQPAHGIVGRNGWLYFNTPGNETVYDFLGFNTLSKEEFLWQFAFLEARREHFASLGVAYYLLIAPNKVTMYPEFLPLPLQGEKGASRREQFMRSYREHIAANNLPDFIIDPTDAMRAAKQTSGLLYYPGDTHWNWTGRLLAGGIVLDRIRNDFPGIGFIPELTMRRQAGASDLAGTLNAEMTAEEIGVFPYPDESQWSGMDISSAGETRAYRSGTNTLSGFFVGDSFLHMYQPMPEAFAIGTVVFHPRGGSNAVSLFENLPENGTVDIVVEEIVERGMGGLR